MVTNDFKDAACYDDVIKWKHFPRYWPFVRGIHRSPVNSPHKGQWRGALMFSLICALNKRLNKQSWGWWFETSSRLLWRHRNGLKFVQNRYFSKIWPRSKIFEIFEKIGILRKVWPKSKIWLKSEFFENSKKSKFFENFDQNRDFFEVLTKIEIFRKFNKNRKFSKILTRIEIFLNFWPNRNYSKIWPNSKFFEIFE